MWGQVRRSLTSSFKDKDELEHFTSGSVILLWWGRADDGETRALLPTCIALQYLRPWRPTLACLKVSTDTDKTRLIDILTALSERRLASEQLHEEDLVTLEVTFSAENLPFITSVLSFISGLDKKLTWSVAVTRLSTRNLPFPSSAGLVKARVHRH